MVGLEEFMKITEKFARNKLAIINARKMSFLGKNVIVHYFAQKLKNIYIIWGKDLYLYVPHSKSIDVPKFDKSV